jgi:hypothetical protein
LFTVVEPPVAFEPPFEVVPATFIVVVPDGAPPVVLPGPLEVPPPRVTTVPLFTDDELPPTLDEVPFAVPPPTAVVAVVPPTLLSDPSSEPEHATAQVVTSTQYADSPSFDRMGCSAKRSQKDRVWSFYLAQSK